MSKLYIYSFKCMHVYCVPRNVKRPDIVKEALMFVYALWSLESEILEKWNLYTLDVTKFKVNILFVDMFNAQVFCKKQPFS